MSDDTATAIDVLMGIRQDLRHLGSRHATWFATRLDSWLAGEVPDLDAAFDVASAGATAWPVRRKHFLRQRDDELREAYGYIEGQTQTQRVDKLHQQAKTVAARWDELRQLERPPREWSGLHASLWFAFEAAERAGQPVPGRNRLETIVATSDSHQLPEVVGQSIEPRAPR